jgi:hypothetical protein
MEARSASLASILVRWGRHDVAERVLRDPELLEHRQVLLLQPALQQALQRASSERNFNVELINLLLEHGCITSACNIASIFDASAEDPFLLISDMRQVRRPISTPLTPSPAMKCLIPIAPFFPPHTFLRLPSHVCRSVVPCDTSVASNDSTTSPNAYSASPLARRSPVGGADPSSR